MNVRILRQQSPFSEPYWQVFNYDGPENATVASLLDYLNYKDDIVDIDGNSTTRIGWECSCLQGMCGGCAMVINGRPALACETFVRDLGKEIEIRPLSKFPVISDLVVDRGIIQQNLLLTNAYIGKCRSSDASDSEGDSTNQGKEDAREKSLKINEKEFEQRYEVAKCLKCGLCLEVCPNYRGGDEFFGALFANDCYFIASRGEESKDSASLESKSDTSSDIEKEYAKHFAAGCSKSLSCMDVCPMKIQTITSIARMNRGKLFDFCTIQFNRGIIVRMI